MKNISCVLPRVCDFKGNLNQRWYVYYYYKNPTTGKNERFKHYKGINVHDNPKARLKAAQILIDELTAQLQSGFNPFDRDDVLYENHLIYDRDDYKGRKKTIDFSIEYYLNFVLDIKKSKIQTNNLTQKTFQAYLTKARSLVKFLEDKKWSSMPIKSFEAEHARLYLDSLWKTIKHNHTYNIYLETQLMLWNEIGKHFPSLRLGNPWTKIDTLRYESTPLKAFNNSQIEKIREYLTQHDLYMLMICEIIYYCFIRPCKELTGLQVKDINFEAKCFIVPGNISKNKKTQPVKIPKQLMDKLVAMNLHRYPENYYLFTRLGIPSLQPAGRDCFSKLFKKVLIKLGFGKGYSIYSWKHTGNKKLAESNIPLKFAQLQNRHHSLDQTATYQQSLTLTNNERLYNEFPSM